MTLRTFFQQLVRVTDSLIGPHIPDHLRPAWPNADELGVTFENTIEWPWHDHQVFARWFEDDDTMELLVTLTTDDSETDFYDLEETLGDTLPDNLEIEVVDTDSGAAIMIALTFHSFTDMTDDEMSIEVTGLLDVASVIARTIAD